MKAPPLAAIIVVAVLLSVAPVFLVLSKESARLVEEAVAQRAAQVEATRPEKPWDFWTPEVENLARELSESRTTIGRREIELAAREKRIADDLAELQQIRRQVEQLRTEVSSRIVEVQAHESRNLKNLAVTYSRLTPPAAVAIFGQMDDLVVAKILSLMKPEIASAILEEFSRAPGPNNANVKRAAELSERLRLLVPAKPAT